MQFLQMESHLDSLVEGFAQTEDAAAADADAGFLSTLDVLSFFLGGMCGADFLEEGRCGFNVAVKTVYAGFFELVCLFLCEEPSEQQTSMPISVRIRRMRCRISAKSFGFL